MAVYRFKGVSGIQDEVYSPTQAQAVRMAKDSQLELVSIKISKRELMRMRDLANLPKNIDNETIVREFITRKLNGR